MNVNDPKLIEVSASLGVQPQWLYNLIRFESGWNPLSKSGMPYNKAKVDKGLENPKFARGLIQFIDSTAIDLGYKSADDLVDRNPDVSSQLFFPVKQYLEKYKPFPTEQSFYLSVFYPAARSWNPNQFFPDSVLAANPGINTPGDYVRKVRGKINGIGIASILLFGTLALLKLLNVKFNRI